MNKLCTFNEWLLNKDEELYQEMKLGNALRGLVAGGLVGLSAASGNQVSPADQFTNQHNAFMQNHYKQSAKMDNKTDNIFAKQDAEEDEEYLRNNLTGDKESDKYVRNILQRRQQTRSIEGTPSQQANDKAIMISAEMDLDAKDPSKIGHEHAKAGDYEQWKKSKELEDFMNRTKTDDVMKKLNFK
jgi:hypothetical protein